MQYRRLGKTGIDVSSVGLGTWQLGGRWGTPFDNDLADSILHTAIDQGINFIDTADVYSQGLSENAIGKFINSIPEQIYVATKCGRQIDPHVSSGYQCDVLRKYVENSLRNLQLDALDLIQLHCPPTEVFYRPEIFQLFADLKNEGKIRHFGVSVEKVEEGLKAIEYENVETVQIIFNMFRQRPRDLFFEEAIQRDVGIIARVPLASGLLTGTMNKSTSFAPEDHRAFNRNGARFDRGETFAGVDFDTGLAATGELAKIFSKKEMSIQALNWILMHDAVSTVIPGASSSQQVLSNVKAAELAPISDGKMQVVEQLYRQHIRPLVHHFW
ncbi:MAG: aldo/keto reductase [Saprospiraceae bacterium]|nr:aldo/keto reductase [Saprospiraceae bacterium]